MTSFGPCTVVRSTLPGLLSGGGLKNGGGGCPVKTQASPHGACGGYSFSLGLGVRMTQSMALS